MFSTSLFALLASSALALTSINIGLSPRYSWDILDLANGTLVKHPVAPVFTCVGTGVSTDVDGGYAGYADIFPIAVNATEFGPDPSSELSCFRGETGLGCLKFDLYQDCVAFPFGDKVNTTQLVNLDYEAAEMAGFEFENIDGLRNAFTKQCVTLTNGSIASLYRTSTTVFYATRADMSECIDPLQFTSLSDKGVECPSSEIVDDMSECYALMYNRLPKIDYKDEIAELHALVAELQSNLTLLETKNNKLAANLTTLETKNNELAANLTTLETKNNELAANLTTLETNINELAANSTTLETKASEEAFATAASEEAFATAESEEAFATAESEEASATAESEEVSATAGSEETSTIAESEEVSATAESEEVSATAESEEVSATAESEEVSATAESEEVSASKAI